ncbi:MAG: hypothetical protein JNG88_18315, partial [Phycisphaerales bacterium]|nr:hypothetical protein [Phycisphaerales bacterium]
YQNRYRTLNSVVGRFLQRDPLGYADSENLYIYVVTNPTSALDSMGLCQEPIWPDMKLWIEQGVPPPGYELGRSLSDAEFGRWIWESLFNPTAEWVLRRTGQLFSGIWGMPVLKNDWKQVVFKRSWWTTIRVISTKGVETQYAIKSWLRWITSASFMDSPAARKAFKEALKQSKWGARLTAMEASYPIGLLIFTGFAVWDAIDAVRDFGNPEPGGITQWIVDTIYSWL